MFSEKAIGSLITIGVMLYILSRFLNTKVGKHTVSLSKKLLRRARGKKDMKKTKEEKKECPDKAYCINSSEELSMCNSKEFLKCPVYHKRRNK